ncbi:MAG TPA: hypothetical protein VK721_15175 [Solirubrobacteraceae bacterium]|nr:hypothetical protein [Solirubrobacteraceae bacterium]
MPTLAETTASAHRLALVGLAKNTGKTVTLTAMLRELEAAGRTVGVTSVGRDGEERDAIDARIAKPRVRLAAGSLVATTDALLRASALAHELVEETGVRTPLGRVLIARLLAAGPIEIAGPSAAADVRAVSDTMLGAGAEQVLIDGAVDRRAASSPQVSDTLVMATGAVLDRELEQVVAQTRDAVELVRLPPPDGSEHSEPVALPPRFALTAGAEQVAELLDANPEARRLLVDGALPERFLDSLLPSLRRHDREMTLVVADPTRVFLWRHGPGWYARRGVHLRALSRTALAALTVNPVAPQSHTFESGELRARLADAIPGVPIFDVLQDAAENVHAQAASTLRFP